MKRQLLAITYLAVLGVSVPAQAQNKTPVVQESSNIEGFINYVLKSSPAIAEAQARVNASKAGKRAASKWQYNPEISFDLEDVSGEDKTKIIGINQTIDWSGKFISSGKTASFELLAVEADRDEVIQNTMLNVLSSLADYRAAKNIYNLAIQRSNLMERFSKLAQKGFKAGDIDQSENNLAQLALSEALIAQADAETALAQSKEMLDSSLGFQLENEFTLPEFPTKLPEIPIMEDHDQIIMALPAIRAIKNREEAAKSAIKQAQKNRIPDPTIGVAGGKDTGTDMVGFYVSIPLNVLNTYGAEVDQAKEEAIAEAKAGQNAYYTAKTRLQSAIRTYKLSQKAWENWQINGAQSLAEQTNLLDRKFKVGDLSATDYLVQIKQALDTQVAAEELHAKVWKSWFAWLYASGTFNQWLKNSGE